MININKGDEWKVDWFFEELETYVRAIITDTNSNHIEDSARLIEIRKTLIDRIVNGEFK